MSTPAIESNPVVEYVYEPVAPEQEKINPARNVEVNKPYDFSDAAMLQRSSTEASIDVPALYGADVEPMGVHQMIDVIGQIVNSMRRSLTEAWRFQIDEIKATGYEAAKLALSQGLATGISSIIGGAAGLSFAGVGISSLSRHHGKWTYGDASPTTNNKLGEDTIKLQKMDIETPYGGSRIVAARSDEMGPMQKMQSFYREVFHKPTPQEKTLVTDVAIKEQAGRPQVVVFKQDIHSVKYKGDDYIPTIEQGKTNTFRFEAGEGADKKVLGLNKQGEIVSSGVGETGMPTARDFTPFSYDGTGRYFVGGQEVARTTGREGSNAPVFGPFEYHGNKTINTEGELSFGDAKGPDGKGYDVHAVEMQAVNTGISGRNSPNPNVREKLYYIVDEKGIEGAPRKVSIEGTGDRQHNVEMLRETERYQSSQNWTQIGSALQLMVQGAGTTTAAVFEEEKIEVQTDKEVASSRAGEIMQYRGDMSSTLTKAIQGLEAIGNAETQAILSV